MKSFGLGLSPAVIVFLAVSESAAQNAAPPPASTETTQPPPIPSAEAPVPPSITPPNPVSLPNPAPPNLAPATAPPQYPYPYPSYGYANPYGGWGLPPKELAYKGGAIPYGYKLEERYNLGLLIAGPTLFGLSYGLTAYSANERPGIGSGNNFVSGSQWDALYIPIAGPFVFSADAPGSSAFIYVFEGLGQVTGIGLFLLGMLSPKNILVRQNANEAFRPSLQVGPGRVDVEMRF